MFNTTKNLIFKGMTLAELSKVFYGLGRKTAYNLDVGQTAMMVFQGVPVN